MIVLIAVILCLVLLLAGSVGYKRTRLATPAPISCTELLEHAILAVKSMDSNMDEMREIFRPSSYAVLTDASQWSGIVRTRLSERVQRAQVHLARMRSNVLVFEKLGRQAVEVTLGDDPLALEIATKAMGCRTELEFIRRRLLVYRAIPVWAWRLMGSKLAQDCLYSGKDLLYEYESLAERVLVFARARGEEYHYESLLAAL